MLTKLSENGMIGMPNPGSMANYGAKDISIRLKNTGLVE